MRSHKSGTAIAIAVTLIGGNIASIAWAGSAGRRNTAIAATAVAVGAWSNGTGRAGRRNTALLATGGAAVAWNQYSKKKKAENRRPRVVRVASRPRVVHVAHRPGPTVVKHVHHGRCGHPGRHLGHHKHKCAHHGGWKKHKHHKGCDRD